MRSTLRSRLRSRRGISLIELAVASALTGVLMVAALQTAWQSVLAQRQSADRSVGFLLANTLLTEIRTLPYREPGTTGEPAIGRDTGESVGARTTFDDVDDFHNLVENPPTARDGSSLANLNGWSRNVTVAWVAASNLTSLATASGAKRITVVVSYNGVTISSLSVVRIDGY